MSVVFAGNPVLGRIGFYTRVLLSTVWGEWADAAWCADAVDESKSLAPAGQVDITPAQIPLRLPPASTTTSSPQV